MTQILILGGLGTVGRTFVKYVLDFNLCASVRIVDKQVPAMVWLNETFKACLNDPRLEVIQADLSNKDHVRRAFSPGGKCPGAFQLVVNLAAETRYGMGSELYDLCIVQLRQLCAAAAVQAGCEKYVEVSTAQIYSGGSSKPSKETDTPKPWTELAQAHLTAEMSLAKVVGLNYSILRLPVVYGAADRHGLMPRIVCAATYQFEQTKMELLWTGDLRLHTVHVQDVAVAIWTVLCAGVKGEIYNCVDNNDTTQGKINILLEKIFRIKTGFAGKIMSTLAKTKLEQILDEANDGHLFPWERMKNASGIAFSPLTPMLEKELLYENHISIDGSKLAGLGWKPSCPHVTKELLLDSILYWSKMKLFPSTARFYND